MKQVLVVVAAIVVAVGIGALTLIANKAPEATPVVSNSSRVAKVGDTITVKYTGKLEDGTVFDSTNKTGQPATFQLAQGSLIQGWVKGIPGMKIGEKRHLVIPPEDGYGPEGNGSIPPNATLIFDIELLAIK